MWLNIVFRCSVFFLPCLVSTVCAITYRSGTEIDIFDTIHNSVYGLCNGHMDKHINNFQWKRSKFWATCDVRHRTVQWLPIPKKNKIYYKYPGKQKKWKSIEKMCCVPCAILLCASFFVCICSTGCERALFRIHFYAISFYFVLT